MSAKWEEFDESESDREWLNSSAERPKARLDLSANVSVPIVKVDECLDASLQQEAEAGNQTTGEHVLCDAGEGPAKESLAEPQHEVTFVTPTNQSFDRETPGAPLAVDPRKLSPDDFRAGRDRPRSRSMPVTLEAGLTHLSPVSLYRKFNWGKLEELPDDFLRIDLSSKMKEGEAGATGASEKHSVESLLCLDPRVSLFSRASSSALPAAQHE